MKIADLLTSQQSAKCCGSSDIASVDFNRYTLQFDDRGHNSAYISFKNAKFCLAPKVLIMLFLSCLWIFQATVYLKHIPYNGDWLFGLATMFGFIFKIVPGWLFILAKALRTYLSRSDSETPMLNIHSFSVWLNSRSHFLSCTFSLGCSLSAGLTLIARSNLHCTLSTNYAVNLCNPELQSNALPQGAAIELMIVTVFIQLIFHSVPFYFIVVSWIISIVMMCIAVLTTDAVNSTLMPVYTAALGVLIYEHELSFINSYLTYLQQEQQINEMIRCRNQRVEAENQMLELQCLIGNVAHDLRSPMQAFTLGLESLEALQKSLTNDHRHIQTISDHISSGLETLSGLMSTCCFMTMTINRSIDFTKVSNGINLTPALEVIDLEKFLNKSISCLKNVQNRVELVLVKLSDAICSHISTDAVWLEDNMLCLLSNAVKYTTTDGGIVRVKCRLTNCNVVRSKSLMDLSQSENEPENSVSISMKSAKYLRIEVEDMGIFISPESRESIFKPFSSIQRKVGGSGLGLFSLQKRVSALGGSCGVMDRRDGMKGSIFWFTIPYIPEYKVAEVYGSGRLIKRSGLVVAVGGNIEILSPRSSLQSQGVSSQRSKMSFSSKINEGKRNLILDVRNSFSNLSLHSVPSAQDIRLEAAANDADNDVETCTNDPEIGEMLNLQAKGSSLNNCKASTARSSTVRGEELEEEIEKTSHEGEGNLIIHSSKSNSRNRSFSAVSREGDVHYSRPPSAATSSKAPEEPVQVTSRVIDHISEMMATTNGLNLMGRPLKILVVDDSLPILKMTVRALQQGHHIVEQAENGASALLLMKSKIYDLVLMDIQMPVMDGLDCTRALREFEASHRPEVRQTIVGVSANSDVATRREAINSGMETFVAKPFTLNRLTELLTILSI